MQTFLPYPSFEKSAKVLDVKRLGKQRVENLQIAKALTDPTYGWQHHPAVNMWRGSEGYLFLYQQSICDTWTNLGYKDTCLQKLATILTSGYGLRVSWTTPFWLGDPRVHVSHQSNLIRKDRDFYEKFFPDTPDDIPYYWPA